ncbi:MAG: hypothetical protein HY741_17100 [Chloroflexi bacterium]|nr:hypothetical protein [Chloroflexota bacterium]
MFDNPGFILFVLAVLVVLGSFAWGTQYNVRRGNNALKWLQQGLSVIGEKTTLRWLGSSVVELKLAKAQAPFRTFDVTIVLEPRDIPIFWALGRLDGRRDLMILRSQLVAAPRFDFEARGAATWKAANAKRDPTGKWNTLAQDVNGLRAEYRGEATPDVVAQILRAAQWEGIHVTRLTLSRNVPNLEVHFLFPNFTNASATHLFSSLRDFSEAALKL